jgi:predicted nucleic acid-binding protein
VASFALVKIVMDTDTVVAAMRSPKGASAALLLEADAGRAALAATVPLFIEYEAVCRRPEHVLASGLDDRGVAVFLDRLADMVEPVDLWFVWRPQLRDPGDEMVLEAAVDGRVDALVTFNRGDFLPAADAFGVPVLLPGDALRRLR